VTWPALAAGTAEALGAGFWLILAAVLAAAGFYVAAAVRRWSRRQAGLPPFTLAELRELRSRGQITEAEFAALRQALLEQAHRATDSTVERQRCRPD
jgi:hypothetical protein